MKKIGIYIHIPFCMQKCIYCDFVSFAGAEEYQKEYIECLKKEIINFKNKMKFVISSIYIGGGTPSFIDSKYIKEILGLFDFDKKIEVTIEVNPGTVTLKKLIDYKDAGVNRLSIGLQSSNNRLLKMLGRIHNYEKFEETFKLAKEAGFDNINVDLMIGLPGQRIVDIKDSLNKVVELGAKHVSVYSLIVEEWTEIDEKISSGELKLPSEDFERDSYWYVKNFLELNGFKHYEISNFAKVGYESKHNLDCWNQKEYRGFGVAAHSYIDKKRFCNISRLEEYIDICKDEAYDAAIIVQEVQNKFDEEKEFMLLGLRKIEGVSIQDFKEKFGENLVFLFRNELSKLTKDGLIYIDGDSVKLSSKGIDLANLVWKKFV